MEKKICRRKIRWCFHFVWENSKINCRCRWRNNRLVDLRYDFKLTNYMQVYSLCNHKSETTHSWCLFCTISLMCSETSVLWWLPWMPMSLSLSYFYLPIAALTYCVEQKTMCCTLWILLVMNIEIRALLSIPIRNFSSNFCWYMENNIIECWRTEIVFLLQLMNILGRWGKFLESLMNPLVLLECFSVVRMRFLYENVVILIECVNCVFERIFGSIFIKKRTFNQSIEYRNPIQPENGRIGKYQLRSGGRNISKGILLRREN